MPTTYLDYMGTDLTIVNAARASIDRHATSIDSAGRGLILRLMRDKHASPFEHCTLSVSVETTIAVSREWFRHRTGSYSELSTRYKRVDYRTTLTEGAPENPPHRLPSQIRRQVGTAMSYSFEEMIEETDLVNEAITASYEASFAAYSALLDQGVAREVARNVLPLGTRTTFIATMNLRNWFNFLVLRTSPAALLEIREEAVEVENILAGLWPIAYNAWIECGRPQI